MMTTLLFPQWHMRWFECQAAMDWTYTEEGIEFVRKDGPPGPSLVEVLNHPRFLAFKERRIAKLERQGCMKRTLEGLLVNIGSRS